MKKQSFKYCRISNAIDGSEVNLLNRYNYLLPDEFINDDLEADVENDAKTRTSPILKWIAARYR